MSAKNAVNVNGFNSKSKTTQALNNVNLNLPTVLLKTCSLNGKFRSKKKKKKLLCFHKHLNKSEIFE